MLKKTYLKACFPLLALAVAACGGTGGGSDDGANGGGGGGGGEPLAEGSKINISGKLNLTSGTNLLLAPLEWLNLLDADTPALSDLKVFCVTFSSPPVAGEGTVNESGAFALTLDAAQQAVGCFINKGDETLGTIVFKDPTKKSLNGSEKTSQREAFGGDTDLGEITFNLATGEAVVDVTQITTKADTSAANSTDVAYDFTGSYKISGAGFDLPTGYVGTCPEGSHESNDSDCRGPEEGEPLWIKRLNGSFVSDGSPAYGIMIWRSEDSFEQCGSTLGISYDDLKENAGVDLSGSGVNEGPFTYTAGWVDGWKIPTATLDYPQMKMERAEIGGVKGNKQYFKSYQECTWSQSGPSCDTVTAAGYSFWGQSDVTGCRTADGEPYQMNDWSNMECTNKELTGGLNQSTCSKTVEGKGTVTCVNINGQFLANGTAIRPTAKKHIQVRFPEDFVAYGTGMMCKNSQNQTTMPQHSPGQREPSCPNTHPTKVPGQKCSELTPNDGSDAYKLAQLRCYADAYWKAEREAQGCKREIRTNWNAKTPAEFLNDNGPQKPRDQFIFEGFEYTSPTSGSFRSTERRFEGIKVGDNWDDCEVMENMTFSLQQAAGTNDLIVEMISEQRLISQKPACLAEYGEEGTMLMKTMFKLVKQ